MLKQFKPRFLGVRMVYALATTVALILVSFVASATSVVPTDAAAPAGNVDDSYLVTIFYFLIALAVIQIVALVVMADSMKMIIWVRAEKEREKNAETDENEKLESGGAGNGKTIAMVATLLFVGLGTDTFAASAADHFIPIDEMVIYAIATINVALLFIILYFAGLLRQLSNDIHPSPEVQRRKRLSLWGRWKAMLTKAVPIEEEDDILMDHEYDGIHELDNRLPPWWLYGFYLSIVVAVMYLTYFHVMGVGQLQGEEYETEMAEAKAEVEAYLASKALNVDENSVTLMEAADQLERGGKTFVTHCVACHGDAGQGGVGPNFADQYWLHGGDIKDLFKVIKYGKPDKGMKSWSQELTPVQMQEVASYILGFQGTNPPNAKEPQGTLWTPEGAVEGATDTVAVDVVLPDSVVETP